MPNYLLPRSQNVTLDPSGNGITQFTIDGVRQRWLIDRVIVRTNQPTTSTQVPTVLLNKNNDPPGTEGGTWDGMLDVGEGTILIDDGDVLYVQWSGGVPGSIATATIHGTFEKAF